MNKLFKIIGWVLGLLGLALGIWSFATSGANVDILLRYMYFLLIAAIVIWIGVAIYIAARNNPKGLLRALVVLIVAAIIVFIAYSLAKGNQPINVTHEYPVSTLKFADTMLSLIYIFGGLAVLAIIYGIIRDASKK